MDFPRQLEEVGKQIHAYQVYEYICITYDYLLHWLYYINGVTNSSN